MAIRMTPEEYRRLTGQAPAAGKPPKYRNRTSWFDGLHFQSDKELRDYRDQKMRLRAGEIAGFLWQGTLIVTEGTDKDNKAVTYRPDIVILNNDGTYEIREDKGYRTRVYINKLKAIRQRYPRIKFTEV